MVPMYVGVTGFTNDNLTEIEGKFKIGMDFGLFAIDASYGVLKSDGAGTQVLIWSLYVTVPRYDRL
ncbi:MAG: hypothetical protein Ct9H90mP18_01930 [Gammaproteobacteria bacterium]|nr:MAG: hypothetical protein Ct9H90mP18_01930 [Gammaproteobacteria bacterium]